MRDLITPQISHDAGAEVSLERDPDLAGLVREHKQMLMEMQQAEMKERTSFVRTITQFERGLARSAVPKRGRP